MMEDLLTIDELSKLLKLKKSTLYSWVHERRIPHLKVGRLLRFRRDSVEKWLKTQDREEVRWT